MARVKNAVWQEKIRDPHIECMSRDEMQAIQSERLQSVVKRVYEHTPFYYNKMKEMGLEPGDIRGIEDIHKLPFTTKEDLRDNYPFGLVAVPQEEIVRVQGTSGTTGKLTLASYSQKDVDVWGECVARALSMAGIDQSDRIHVCYGYGLFTGGLGIDFGARELGAMSIPMSAGNTKRQIMCMEDFGATAFACTPSYALYLAESIREAGLVDKMKIRVGIHGAEPWTEEMRKEIEDILDIDCFDIYGLCEITGPGVAMDCIHHKGLHVFEDHFYPEVLNPKTNEPCADNESGELVFTTLSKEAMPLLRYRTKDITSIQRDVCECGRTLPRIQKFTGRTDDMKVIRGVNVFPTQVEAALLSMGGVAPHYKMIVDRVEGQDVLTVMVEVDEQYFSDEIRKLDELKQRVGKVLKETLGISVKVRLVEPKSIERSEGKAVRVIDNRDL
ncbi:phenylacetate-coenzyme A ligase PaaK-like adenylate-forming protein [Lachnospiraceae bacterium PF1-21]|uniref:Phenylacetate-coenzyme A ligase n=1 Tax=Ohessyouella blattaphilus TaxID=2949333 RepID=A0ABT1EHU2_9FIRM|nr:phenylacetate--CoA ligase [Ohessyouella blattaphilus]MCP1110248.1 phenylacetate--CoA ligase [Ohessyouella blattaphilus]MCR8563642.1 phenylacetate--CoA ligase [Ohessyouella blattaphilus]